MDNFTLLPKPYLRRSIPAEKIVINQRVSAELRRIIALVPIKKAEIEIQHDFDLNNINSPNSLNLLSNFLKKDKLENIPKSTLPTKNEKPRQRTGMIVGSEKTLRSDTISNIPTGNFSIGYNCPLIFTSKLDYERIWGTVHSTFVWYFVPPSANGDYDVYNNGVYLGIYSKHKDTLTTEEVVRWYWENSLYNNLNYPSVKFKIAVMRYDDGMPGGSTLSEEVIANFDTLPCINIQSLDLTTTNSNGGYPSVHGGNNGAEPTVNVYINSPAPPGGQVVTFSLAGVSNTNPSAWINSGKQQAIVTAGQTSVIVDGIVGTRSVMSTKDIHVRAAINGNEASCTLRITNK